MKFKTLAPLCASLLLLAACSTGGTTSSTAPASTSEEPSTSQAPLSLKGYSLTKERDTTKEASYKLADVIKLETLTSLSQLMFSSSNEDIATVDANGIITRKEFGSASIAIRVASDPTSLFKISTFQITFSPEDSKLLGQYVNTLDAPEGKTEVKATIELKANNTFELTYTAGVVLDTDGEGGRAEYTITAQTVTGTYVPDSVYKFTVTTESFPYKKTFSGQINYNEGTPVLRAKVPLAENKLSRIYYFEKDNK